MRDYRSLISKYPPHRDQLLEIVHELAENNINYIDPEILKFIAKRLRTTVGDIYGTITFYSLISKGIKARNTIRICSSAVCKLKRSEEIKNFLLKFLDCDSGGLSKDGLFIVEEVECLGMCDVAPAMMINHNVYGNLTESKVKKVIEILRDESINK